LKRIILVTFIAAFAAAFAASCATVPRKVETVSAPTDEAALRQEAEALAALFTPTATATPVVIYEKGHTVKKGETLWQIARRLSGSGFNYLALAVANNINRPEKLEIGTELKVPSGFRALKKKSSVKAKPEKFEYRVITNRPFGVGEKLVYAVKYFNVVAGYGILEIAGIGEIHGRKIYQLRATAKTAPFFETFYRVRDYIESDIDVLGIFSHRYSKKLEEGGYRAFSEIEFDHEKRTATKTKTGEVYETVPFVQDVLSELYYYRTFDLSPGKNDEVYIDTCADDGKTYQIVVRKLGYEKITTDAGEFDCIKVQPLLKYEGIFRQQGDVYIWMTNDANKIPVLVRANIMIGSIDAILQNAKVVNAR